jgi:hypothetical protein
MAITFVVSVSEGNGVGSTNTVTTPAITTTGSNFSVAMVTGRGSLTMADSNSNTWTPLTLQSDDAYGRLYYVLSPTVGGGHTFTATDTGDRVSVAVACFSGVATSSAFDAENGKLDNSGGTTSQPGSITPSVNGELVIAACGGYYINQQVAFPLTVDSGVTSQEVVLTISGVQFGISLGYLIQNVAAAINPTWAVNAGASGVDGFSDVANVIASFKPSAGAGDTLLGQAIC